LAQFGLRLRPRRTFGARPFSRRLSIKCRAPAPHRRKIIPAKASALNKSRFIAAMIGVAAAKPVRREASLRGGRRAEGSSDQQGNTR
jgi:hypothetical protein